MPQYHRTFRNLKKSDKKTSQRFKVLKVISILIVDSFITLVVTIKKILAITLFKYVPFIFITLYYVVFKLLLVPSYRLLLRINRKQRALIKPGVNKLFFLFSNRYVSHTVAVLIVLITLSQNMAIRQLRAEDYGRDTMFVDLFESQNFFETITEEEIIIPDLRQKSEAQKPQDPPEKPELSPGITQKITLGYDDSSAPSPALAQGGTAIIKPDLSETMDTPKPRKSTITYTVQENDTVFDIAERFNVSVNTILWANNLSSRSIIRPGQDLRILPVSGVEHKVKSGDSIGKIAGQYNVPQEDILVINKIEEGETLSVGQALIIPDGRPLYIPPPTQRYVASTPKYAQAPPGGDMFWPTSCRRITQYFKGWLHTGVDIACPYGSNIYAAEDGTVERAGWNSGGYGNRIIIAHPDGSKTLYAHLKIDGIEISPGDYVKKGQVIGYMGSTGRSTGSHVHFEVIISGTRVNPFNRL